jgi:hypothetical protein
MENKGKNWKTTVTLLIAVVFCVTWFAAPARALSYDPQLPKLLESEADMPFGDEGGWNDTDGTTGTGFDGIANDFDLYFSKYFIFYFVPGVSEQDVPVEQDYDSTTDRHADRSRTTPPR